VSLTSLSEQREKLHRFFTPVKTSFGFLKMVYSKIKESEYNYFYKKNRLCYGNRSRHGLD